MQKRGFLILVAATVIVVAAAVAAVATGNRGVSGPPPSVAAFPGLAEHVGDVATVRLSGAGVGATFIRDDGRWSVREKDGYPADAGRIRQIVLALADLKLVEPKTGKAALYPRLQVEDPGRGDSHLVALADKAGATMAALIVGKARYDRLGTGSNGVYVRKPGAATAWLAEGTLDLSGKLAKWLDRRILDIPDARIASVVLTAPDGTKLTLARKTAKDAFAVTDLPPAAKVKNEDAAAQPATLLEELDLDDVAAAAKLPVPPSGVTTAALTAFDGLTVTVRLFQNGTAGWVAIAAGGSGKAAAEAKKINDRVARWVYAIPSDKADLMKLKLADLLAAPKS